MKMLTFVLGLLLVTQGALAKDKTKKQHKGEFLKKELAITDEQLEKVREIRKSSKGEMKQSKVQFKALKQDFKAAIQNSNVSEADLTAKFEAFQKARDEFQRKRFSMMLKMRKILSPQQLEKFHAMKKKNKANKKKQ